jgi:hypothetical protein
MFWASETPLSSRLELYGASCHVRPGETKAANPTYKVAVERSGRLGPASTQGGKEGTLTGG